VSEQTFTAVGFRAARAIMVGIVLGLLVAGCGDGNGDGSGAPADATALSRILGLGVNPSDGALFIATHNGR
jgi:hypothetical protein